MQLHTPLLFPLSFINLGLPELSVIVLLVLMLFGPGKLPGVMKSLGDGVKQFKDSVSGNAAASPSLSDKAGKPE